MYTTEKEGVSRRLITSDDDQCKREGS